MQFNSANFNIFRADVEKALEVVAKKHKVNITCGKIKYGDFDFDMNLNVVKADNNVDGKRMLFNEYCEHYGFTQDDYERQFIMSGKRYKLVGFNIKSPKNCCSILCLDNGTMYKCSTATVKSAFASGC